MGSTVLLVDDDSRNLFTSITILRGEGVPDVVSLDDSRNVLPFLAVNKIAVLVLDLSMPHLRGEDLLVDIKRDFPEIQIIIMTGNSEIETAVECMKAGAVDYLVKPVEKNRFVSSIKNALRMDDMALEISRLKKHLLTDSIEQKSAFSSILTTSKKMHALFQYAEVVAKSKQPVLITGETGSGKGMMAKAIHALSNCKGAFVEVNVAGLDDTMFSDTLFGHKKGAFTGAERQREGMIIHASGGTLFLDEIGDMKESSQIKLLHLLDEGRFLPLGSDVELQSDARVVVATNQGIQGLISEGKFRKDLYYRIRGHHINIPPLRERIEDVPLLLDHFLDSASDAMGEKRPQVARELYTLLSAYHFPGNIRELKAMVFDSMARHRHGAGSLSLDNFKAIIGQTQSCRQENSLPICKDDGLFAKFFGRFPTLKETEEYLVHEALEISKGNQGIAATLLGLSRQALNKRLVRNNKSAKKRSGEG